MSFFTSTRLGALLVAIGALLVVVAALGAISAGVGAQADAPEALENETVVPGVDAGETRNVTVEILWNASADAANDSATVEIEHVLSDGTVNATTTDSVPAAPGNWTFNQTTLQPADAVDEFHVNVTATDASVIDDMEVYDDASGAGGIVGDGLGTSGGIAGLVVLIGIGWLVADRREA